MTRARFPLLCAGLLAAAPSVASAQVIERSSVSTSGTEADDATRSCDISGGGRYVVFASRATNLVQGDTNGFEDVFIRDTALGSTKRMSVDKSGNEADGISTSAHVSADGTQIVFSSAATNLVAGDANGTLDIFVKDWPTGQVELVSVQNGGGQASGASYTPEISADGTRVVYRSLASDLVPGDTNGAADIFLYDRTTKITTLVSQDGAGTFGNGDSFNPAISADGRFVAFESDADNLVPGDANGATDIFLFDVASGKVFLVSELAGNVLGNGDSTQPSISGDGRYVAFTSFADNLVPGDTNGHSDIFVADTKGGLYRASVGPQGLEANGPNGTPDISDDGRFVVFTSNADNLSGSEANTFPDVFVHDLQVGSTSRVSVDASGALANSSCFDTHISADGSAMVFWSFADNLVPGDANGHPDVFFADRYQSEGVPYCTAGASASGCQATVLADGTASASSSAGYIVKSTSTEGQKDGLFFFGVNGAQGNQWGNGSSFQCVVPPVKRTMLQSSGGTAGACDGSFVLDFNAWAWSNPSRAPEAGSTVWMQAWYRDPGNTSNQTTSFSSGWQFVFQP